MTRISVWVAVLCPATRRVLLARRAPSARNGGQWNVFGGGCDPGERPRDAALRELTEEGGIHASSGDLVQLGEARTHAKRHILYGLTVETEFTPLLNDENVESCWVAVTDINRVAPLHRSTLLLMPYMRRWTATQPLPSGWCRFREWLRRMVCRWS
jgi:8-oxo-dGTP diphosphatase